MNNVTRWIAPAVIAAVVITAAVVLFTGGGQKTVVAHFPRTVSVYQGSDVRILGVPVGKVDKIVPNGTDVIVTMHYNSDVKVPADAKAVIVSPSIVGDRYVQLAPAYKSGPTLKDGAVLDTSRTAVPVELDDIYNNLDQLVTALGPNGANKNGALTDLLNQTAANFGGEGAQFHQTIQDFGKLSQTLDDNKDQIFGSAKQLEGFVSTLAQNDQTVRGFSTSLAQVSAMLKGERGDLAQAMHNLAVALGDVSTFVNDNRTSLHTDIAGLNRFAKVLVKRRNELAETLKNAPLALSNLMMTYDPDAGTLNTNSNLQMIAGQIQTNPKLLTCTLADQIDKTGSLCKLLGSALPRSGIFGEGTGSSIGQHTDPTLGGLVR